MKLLFVRHAKAMERDMFLGADDLLRPLTEEGRKKARNGFGALARFYQRPMAILTSKATRAIETAEILSEAFGGKIEIIQSHLLNPGASIEELKEVVIPRYDEEGCLAIVGHEPDFSCIISQLISKDDVALEVKKASVIEIEIDRYFHGELRFMIPPKFLNFLRKVMK
jgi:phosphohistidine phosphatase